MKENFLHVLEELNMTNAEAKVYLSLLELQESQTGRLIKEADIAASKVYTILDKLQKKGLVSFYVKNGVKQFRPARPERILEYLEEQKDDLERKKQEFKSWLPKFHALPTATEHPTSEVYTGWLGMDTVYREIRKTLQEGDENWVLGASSGEDEEKTKAFFVSHCRRLMRKGVKYNMLVNESARGYITSIEKEGIKYAKKRFLSITTPVEINVFKDCVALVRLKKEPIVFLIRDKETADSFLQYFQALWEIGIE